MADQDPKIGGFPGLSGVGGFPGLKPKKTSAEEKTERVAKGAIPHPDAEPTDPTPYEISNPDPNSPAGTQAGRTGHVAEKVLKLRAQSQSKSMDDAGSEAGASSSEALPEGQANGVRRLSVGSFDVVEEEDAAPPPVAGQSHMLERKVEKQEAVVEKQEAVVEKQEAVVTEERGIRKEESVEDKIKNFSLSDQRVLRQVIGDIDELVGDKDLPEQEMMERIAGVFHENEGRLSPEARAFLYREMERLGINVSELRVLIEKKQLEGERKENEAAPKNPHGPAPAQAPKIAPQRSDSKGSRSTEESRGRKKKRREETLSRKGGIDEAVSRIKSGIRRRKKQRTKDDLKADEKKIELKADEDRRGLTQQTEA